MLVILRVRYAARWGLVEATPPRSGWNTKFHIQHRVGIPSRSCGNTSSKRREKAWQSSEVQFLPSEYPTSFREENHGGVNDVNGNIQY